MSLVLPHIFTEVSNPYLAVCEGFGDAQFISVLLKHLHVTNCSIGCPSTAGGHGSGKSGIKKYLEGVAALVASGKAPIKGLLVVGDADEDEVAAFTDLADAIENAGFPRPRTPFTSAGKHLKVATYVIPGDSRRGTLVTLPPQNVSLSELL
jgi:hypothetical protein